ncbi:uncharacterized protein LOC107035686 [Diachasma alloeum]|uniref:uncharacterized protein LOC107035686 n=1 Tax=Diachasma alloeum TaxID=454923 RepID=UPI000738495F|nr:uncharacterized protein LOC107035686 [Diachasma alloeum]
MAHTGNLPTGQLTMESTPHYPIYTKGTVLHSKDPNDYTCHICPENQTPPLEHHLKDEKHVQRLKHYTQNFINTGPLIDCKLCFKRIDPNQVIEHALAHKLAPWYVPEDSPEILFKNFICHLGGQYFCHLCNVKMPFWSPVECHYKDRHHQTLKRDKIDEVILQGLSFTVSHYQLAINNSIFMKSSKCLSCSLCDCEVGTLLEDIILHIRGKFHIQNQKKSLEALKTAKICRLFSEFHTEDKTPGTCLNKITSECNNNSVCQAKVTPKASTARKSPSDERKKGTRIQRESKDKNISLSSPRLTKRATRDGGSTPRGKFNRGVETAGGDRLIKRKNTKADTPTRTRGTPKKDRVTKRVSSPLINKSALLMKNSASDREVPADFTRIMGNNHFCRICGCQVDGYSNILQHLNGKRHLENLGKGNGSRNSEVKVDKASEFHDNSPAAIVKVPKDALRDENVDIPSKGSDSYAAKAKLPAKKKSKRKRMPKSQLSPQKNLPCLVCGERFEYAKGLHRHMTRHFWRRFLEAPPVDAEAKSPGGAATDEINGDSTGIPEGGSTESSEDEGDLEFEEERSRDSPGRRFHFSRNSITHPLDIALDDKLNIYAGDKQKIEDIKLGVLLSFSIDKDNIYCLVCRKSVENSLQNFYEHLCSVNHLDYFQEMIEDHKKFKDYPDQLSDLALAHEYMEEVSEDVVQCHACGIPVKNDSIKLKDHVDDASHVEKCPSLGANARDWFTALCSRMEANFYSALTYWCVPCETYWTHEIEFRKHLNERSHKEEMQAFKGETMIFDFCALCGALWYGFLKTFHYHSTCKMHRNQAFSSHYLVNKIPHAAERLLHAPEKKIEEILTNVETRRIDSRTKEDQLIRDLERISKETYPRVKAYPFGSRVSGLGGRNSDLDIFLDCSTCEHQVYSGENSSFNQISVRIGNIEQCLENDVQNWHIDRVIRDCRIPIIKATHRPTGIECDISFSNGLTVENTKLISAYCENYHHCRKLIVFVKNWMGHCTLTGHHGINSYGIAWLVIYFLQVKMILPTVSELMKRGKQSRMIAGWETRVTTDFQPRDNAEGFRELLVQFFKFYEAFDYRNYVICPLVGRAVAKRDFQRPEVLPRDMKTYLNYLGGGDDPEAFRVDSVMCLQDPLDLAHNISKAVRKCVVHRFKTLCSLSVQILDNDA